MPARTILLRLMLWSLGIAAAAGVLAVLFQGGALVVRIVGTGLVTAVACVLLIATSSLIDRERTAPQAFWACASCSWSTWQPWG